MVLQHVYIKLIWTQYKIDKQTNKYMYILIYIYLKHIFWTHWSWWSWWVNDGSIGLLGCLASPDLVPIGPSFPVRLNDLICKERRRSMQLHSIKLLRWEWEVWSLRIIMPLVETSQDAQHIDKLEETNDGSSPSYFLLPLWRCMWLSG